MTTYPPGTIGSFGGDLFTQGCYGSIGRGPGPGRRNLAGGTYGQGGQVERKFWSTIRGKLLSRTLLVVLLPVLIIGGAAVYALFSLADTADVSVAEARTALSEDVVGDRVAGASDQIAREIAIFLDERLSDLDGFSTDSGFIRSARSGTARANLLGLVDMPIEEVETMFFDNPRLGTQGTGIEQTLIDVVANTPVIQEIFMTDVNGFNVEYSNRTSDFVQYDEEWWQIAMNEGLDISEPEFDPSAGVFAVDIAMRIEDAGEPVGVLKAALDVALVQSISDRFTGTADGLNVAILDADGRFLAETSSGHEPSHIMNTAYVAADAVFSNARIAEALAPNADELHPDGFSIDDEWVGGYGSVGDQLVDLRDSMANDLRAFDWTVVVEQPSEVAFAALAPLEGLADEVTDTGRSLSLLLAIIGVAGLLIAALVALVFGRRLVAPIAQLRDAAVEAAEVTLPNVVAQIDELDEDDEFPEVPLLVLDTGDEVEDLAHSFNTVQQTAANLASAQARLRRKNVATTFVNLGRRNQNLLTRQLEHINSMESRETDSATLQRLFELDHLATRMRRNAESLLVLAGEETPRRFRQPVTMHQLLQAAGSEIEDFARIELGTVDEASIEGGVASDVAHLLAELLENASSFSPPTSKIQVHGRVRTTGYALAIVDQGIGMGEAEMTSANARLADPAEFDRAPSAFLGHFVVGHLSRRHDIHVQLIESPYGGVTAQLHLPSDIIVAQPPAKPASDMHADASPDTHVASSDNDTARELAEIAALEASLEAIEPSAPTATPAPAPAPVPKPELPAPPPAPVAEAAPAVPPVAPTGLGEGTFADAVAPAPNGAAESLNFAPRRRKSGAAAETVQAQAAPVVPQAQVAPQAPVAPQPQPAPVEPQVQAQQPAMNTIDRALNQTARLQPQEPVRMPPPLDANALAEQPAAMQAAMQAPAHASAPAPVAPQAQAAPVAPARPAVEPLTLPPRSRDAAPAPARSIGSADTTPSGFRRRRRGQEGAPRSETAPAPVAAAKPSSTKRSPKDVQASLLRFRRGVEAGRAQAGQPEQSSTAPGDAQ